MMLIMHSGGTRGGVQGGRSPAPFWVKKEEITEGRNADRASKNNTGLGIFPPLPDPHPSPLVQGLFTSKIYTLTNG